MHQQQTLTFKQIRPNILLGEFLLYGLAIILALTVSHRLSFSTVLPVAGEEIKLGKFLLIFFVATSALLFTVRYFKNGRIWKIIFALGVFAGIEAFLSAFMVESAAVWLALAVVVARFIFEDVLWHNTAVLLGIVGISSLLGLRMPPYSVIGLLAALSVYDFIAVYKTKHMVKLAMTMIQNRAVLAFIMPEKWTSWRTLLNKVETGKDYVFIGGGDVALPLVMTVSVAQQNYARGIVVAFFVLAGVLCTHLLFISQKEVKPIPALPPLALFSILGFFVSLLVVR